MKNMFPAGILGSLLTSSRHQERAILAFAWLGSFLGILCIAALERFVINDSESPFLIGSFGASCVLVFGAPASPLAQPRNLIGGHLVSALVGVACQQMLPEAGWLAAALAVSTAILLMSLTKTLHPPGGATALIAVAGGEGIHGLGWLYPLFPCLAGALILLAVGLVSNNIVRRGRYPLQWF